MKPEIIRDYVNDKVPAIFDCHASKRLAWAVIGFAVGYFGIIFSSHFIA